MQIFADDLAWICNQIELVGSVVIGHSMGGIVAFDLAARYPDLPSAVVMLDAAVMLPSAAYASGEDRGRVEWAMFTKQGRCAASA